MMLIPIIVLFVLISLPSALLFIKSLRNFFTNSDELPANGNKKLNNKKRYIILSFYGVVLFSAFLWLCFLIGQKFSMDTAVLIFTIVWTLILIGSAGAFVIIHTRQIHPPPNNAPLTIYNEFWDAYAAKSKELWRRHWKRDILLILAFIFGMTGILVLGIFIISGLVF